MKRNSRFIEKSITGALSFLQEAMFADEFASKNGYLQARDPRAKVFMIFFMLLAVLLSKSILFISFMYALSLLLAFISSINVLFFLKRTWFFIPIFSLCIAVPALFDVFSPGEPFFTFGFFTTTLTITKQGLLSATIFFLRVLTCVSLGVLMSLTTRHYVLLKVLRLFRFPQIFTLILGMCYRYVYLFIEMIQNMYAAIRSRVGFVSSTTKGQRIVAWNMANLWRRSYHMQSQVYDAMVSRGFSGEPQVFEEFHLTLKDWIGTTAAALLLIGGLVIL